MSYNYLDKTGLASVWAKIKAALATKANSADLADIATSGSYEDLNDIPEILTTNDDVVTEDQIPYLFRKSPDSDRAVEEIVGGTVVWNQLLNPSNYITGTYSGISVTKSGDILLANGTATSNAYIKLFSDSYPTVSGHKYLVLIPTNSDTLYYDDSTTRQYSYITSPSIFNGNGNNIKPYCRVSSGVTVTNVKVHIGLTDLTTMFGSTIADYIYSLETATAGAGVAKLKEWGFFTEDYYEYCEPTLKSVEGLVSKKTVGFNQWDEEYQIGYWNVLTGQHAAQPTELCSKNYIPVIPNTTYFYHKGGGSALGDVIFYDENKAFISGNSNGNRAFTTPNNCHYIHINFGNNYGTTYKSDICINLSDPTKNGAYEPYESHTYSLDSEVVLRGVPKLDSNNNLYFDGDIYPSNGNGSRKYALVDLGTLNYSEYGSTNTVTQYYTTDLDVLVKNNSYAVSDVFVYSTILEPWTCRITNSTGKTYLRTPKDQYSSPANFKTAMSGIYLLYELATPTTFTAQPYHNPQIVGDTEEFVTTGLVPVGHATKYHTSYYTTNDYIKEKGYLTEKDVLGKVNTSDLATVATSGNYNDLDDTPTKVSDFENDAAYMSGMTILEYGKSNWTDFYTAYTEKKVVYCRASSASNPASGSQTRLAFMAYVNNAESPTEVEFQYYRSVSSHSNNQQGDQVYVYKLTKSGGWSVTVRESYTKVVAGTGLSGNWASGAITLSLNTNATATTSANGLMSSTDKSRLDTLYADYSSALTALGVN